MPPTIDVPPFPTLTFDSFCWVGSVRLRTWAGFQMRQGPYASVSSKEASDGTVRLFVHCPGSDPFPPTDEQVAAFAYLIQDEKSVTDSVLTAIFEGYPQFREETLDAYDFSEASLDLLPEITRPEQLRPLVGLSIVHILVDAKDSRSYIGFEFGCVWEGEHGLGVMTHGDRALQIGSAEDSFILR